MCLLFSVIACMQFPSADKDWFIFFASSNVSPYAPVFPIFSEPAKSTRFNFPYLVVPSRVFYISVIINTECERDDTAFISVEAA